MTPSQQGPDLEALWDYDDAAGSAAAFLEAEAGASPGDVLLLRTQRARALGLGGDSDAAWSLLDEVAAVTERSAEVDVRLSLERGRLLRSAGADGALARFREAARLASRVGLDALYVDALHMQALVADGPEDQVATTRVALAAARASSDPAATAWEASLLHNLGCAQVDADQLPEALETFRMALSQREARGQVREAQVARWMVAWTLRLLDRHDEALGIQRALKAELDEAGIVDEHVDAELALLRP